jgi:hypothetical protein
MQRAYGFANRQASSCGRRGPANNSHCKQQQQWHTCGCQWKGSPSTRVTVASSGRCASCSGLYWGRKSQRARMSRDCCRREQTCGAAENSVWWRRRGKK